MKRKPKRGKAAPDYSCTECHADATIGYMRWAAASKGLIKNGERLCTRCARKRGVTTFF